MRTENHGLFDRCGGAHLLVCSFVLLGLLASLADVVHAQAPRSIGINFGGSQFAMSPSDEPGVAPGANWNNIIGDCPGGCFPSVTGVPLSDNSGASTAATLSYSAHGFYNGFTPPSTPNSATNNLYSGGLFSSIGPVTVSISDIPYAVYKVYVYASNDSVVQATMSVTSGITTFYYRSPGFQGSPISLLLTTSQNPLAPTIGVGQYQIFDHQTNPTFSISTGGQIAAVISNNVFGVQVVEILVPTNKDQCKNGGWQDLARANGTTFNNQGDCIQYVNTGK